MSSGSKPSKHKRSQPSRSQGSARPAIGFPVVGFPVLGDRFPARLRIKSRDQFRLVFEHGKVAADGILVVHAVRHPGKRAKQTETSRGRTESSESRAPTNRAQTQLGLSIPKKVGNAPLRNRWKRLIREAFRTQRADLPANMLVVVRPRRGAVPDAVEIRKSLKSLLWRLAKKLRC